MAATKCFPTDSHRSAQIRQGQLLSLLFEPTVLVFFILSVRICVYLWENFPLQVVKVRKFSEKTNA
jgi:hypothetical protein